MSLDRLFKSDERSFISPVIHLRNFLDEAFLLESRMHDFFQTQPMENNANQDGDPGGSIPQITEDSRDIFQQFMVQHGQSTNDAETTINGGDLVLANMLEDNPIDEYEITFPPKDSKLMTHRVLHNIREKKYTASAIKNGVVGRGKYFKYREQELKRNYNYIPQGIRSNKDILLTVHILKPINRPPEQLENLNFKQRCEVKMLIRGSMPLVKLREKIFCASDFWPNCQDFTPQAQEGTASYFNTKFPSGFIFIHDTFYIDYSKLNSIDISEPIREFMQRKHKDFGEYFVKDMANSKIIDLQLRLGQPYLYFHQGKCEHLLIFTDLRLLNSTDMQNLADYPIRLFDVIPQKLCSVCSDEVAAYIVTESDRLPMSPAFFCDKCFRIFHYDNGQRIGLFKAYHYVNHAGIE